MRLYYRDVCTTPVCRATCRTHLPEGDNPSLSLILVYSSDMLIIEIPYYSLCLRHYSYL